MALDNLRLDDRLEILVLPVGGSLGNEGVKIEGVVENLAGVGQQRRVALAVGEEGMRGEADELLTDEGVIQPGLETIPRSAVLGQCVFL